MVLPATFAAVLDKKIYSGVLLAKDDDVDPGGG